MTETAVAKRDDIDTALAEIDEVVENRSLAALGDLRGTRRAVALARSMNALRRLIRGPVLDELCALAGTDLGFKTDRDAKPKQQHYTKEVVRDCLIEGMLRGAMPCGNEINIISGRCYLTKQYFERMVRGLVEELRIIEGVPHMKDGGALVPMTAAWVYRGQRDGIKCCQTDTDDTRIPVRVNSGMGIDAVIGKAYRKLYARIYRRVTGSQWIEQEATETPVETIDTEEVEGKAEVKQEVLDDDARFAASLRDYLEEMSAIREVNEHRRRTLSLALTDEQRKIVDEMCDERIASIRAARGERANGQPAA